MPEMTAIERNTRYDHQTVDVIALFSRQRGSRRWVDQTPHYVLMADVLADMFPDAVFLHILRDGRSTVHSLLHFQHRECAADFVPGWATDFEQACAEWRISVMAAVNFQAAFSGRCLTVRHDRLAANRQDTFADIFQFIQVPSEEGPVAFVRTKRVNSRFPADCPLAAIPTREWSGSQRKLFITEAGATAVKVGLATERELEAWLEATPGPATAVALHGDLELP